MSEAIVRSAVSTGTSYAYMFGILAIGVVLGMLLGMYLQKTFWSIVTSPYAPLVPFNTAMETINAASDNNKRIIVQKFNLVSLASLNQYAADTGPISDLISLTAIVLNGTNNSNTTLLAAIQIIWNYLTPNVVAKLSTMNITLAGVIAQSTTVAQKLNTLYLLLAIVDMPDEAADWSASNAKYGLTGVNDLSTLVTKVQANLASGNADFLQKMLEAALDSIGTQFGVQTKIA